MVKFNNNTGPTGPPAKTAAVNKLNLTVNKFFLASEKI